MADKTEGVESTGSFTVTDIRVDVVEEETQEAAIEEKEAQNEYERVMTDADSKRAEDSSP